MAAIQELLGDTLQNHGASQGTLETCKPGMVVGLYFSAHWCPPCRGFTPKLAEFYKKYTAAHPGKLEIVFVSSDRDEASFNGYFENMPWLALPYSKQDVKQKLSTKYGVRGIPTFILLDADTGEVINKAARGGVESDPEGTNFPWKQ